ncbi:hypothetical protein [Streptomyces sp. NPDC017890]|uniref:hypothetical protein n=1 Tax=Streptomyces sp. NPDC017890 TaxID=3365015 RepID=UPI0037A46963
MASVAERMLLVGPGDELLRSAVTSGFDLWVVQEPGEPVPASVRVQRVFVAGPAAAPDGTLHALLAGLVRRYGIGQVLCGPHAGPAVRAVVRRLRRELSGRLWHDPAAERLRHPVTLRRLLLGGTRPPVRAEEAADGDEARAAAELFGPPVVIKSRGARADWRETAVVRDVEHLTLWAKTAEDGPHLVEELLTGPLFRMRTLSLGGMHHVVSVVRLPGDGGGDRTAPEAVSAIRSCVRELLDLAGFANGALCTDVVLTPQGPRIAGCADGGSEPR